MKKEWKIVLIIAILIVLGLMYFLWDKISTPATDDLGHGCIETCRCMNIPPEILERYNKDCLITYEELSPPLNFPGNFEIDDYLKEYCSNEYSWSILKKGVTIDSPINTGTNCENIEIYEDSQGNKILCGCEAF